MKAFKSWKSIFNVMPMGEGSLVKWTTEFEKQNDDVPDPVRYGEFLTTWTKNKLSMDQIKRMECQVQIKSSADKFFDAYKTKAHLMLKMADQAVRDVKLLNGSDWNSEGSVRQWYMIAGGKLISINM
ncbi:hypothetical protein Gotri_002889 [Gossypium trilobum]|uniref:Bet v I/Major latex protein domain-containing protein n=1 Tax=Gossypium trilobum TaxID=34281 RepID=A0A7J9FA26_9ROSI|nr:hypothetical protein [Gossypium trilobum]